MKTKNVHGRVGVKRRDGSGAVRTTNNQALKREVQKLRGQLERLRAGSVDLGSYRDAIGSLRHIEQMTAKSKTGVAKKVHEYVVGELDDLDT